MVNGRQGCGRRSGRLEVGAPAVRREKPPTSLAVHHDLIQAVVSALEARDPHAAEHSLRVADMVERTCALMGLPGEQAGAIHIAAHLHDIGKIGVPDAVLRKRSRLTPEEHAVLRDHARIGAEIIEGVPGFSAVAGMVRHHHERWDGTGYPDGLAGRAIPFGARVIAVCDSIDAMLGKRRAKRSLTKGECVQEVFAGMGTAYDPEVAWYVLKCWDAVVGPVDFDDSDDFEADGAVLFRRLQCSVSLELAEGWSGSAPLGGR